MFNYKDFGTSFAQRMRNELIKEIEEWDLNYYKTKHNKKEWSCVEIRSRKIFTEFGEVLYKRRKYRNKITGEWKCFTDEHFGVEYNKHITSSLKQLVYDEITNGKTNQQIKQSLPQARISVTSISTILGTKVEVITQPCISKKK